MTSIRSIACALPDQELSNSDLERENPSWDMARVTLRTGVSSRRVAAADETAFDLSVRACDALLAEADLDLDTIDAILYCTQNPDYRMPGNSSLLHRHLGLRDEVLAFDYPLACSGYVYGLAFADSFARSGLASEMLLVTAETYSKQINPRDRSSRALFGDGAAVTHACAADGPGGRIVAAKLCTNGAALERVYIPAGGARMPRTAETGRDLADDQNNVRSAEDMRMDGAAIWGFMNSTVPGHVRAFLGEQGLTTDDVDLYVFHQGSRMLLDSLTRALAIDPAKVFVNMAEVGNLVSASIPCALRAALDDGVIEPGHRVLLSGFGAGISYGSVLLDF